jgi:hypothetical protein
MMLNKVGTFFSRFMIVLSLGFEKNSSDFMFVKRSKNE